MKRYRFVLILLILTVSATGCRRRANLFGRRGARCDAQQTVYSQGAAVAPPAVVYCPPACPVDCPVVSSPVVSGPVVSGPVVSSEVYGGEVSGDPVISEEGYVEPYNGASLSPGRIPSLGAPDLGESISYRNVAPSLPSSLGRNVYGRPMFQVVGDRRLNPDETLPDLEGETTAPTKSDKTVQAPKE